MTSIPDIRKDEGLVTILFVFEMAQTRTLVEPSIILRASIRYSVPLAAVTKGSPGAVDPIALARAKAPPAVCDFVGDTLKQREFGVSRQIFQGQAFGGDD